MGSGAVIGARVIACPVCSAAPAELFLVRDPVPVHQNLIVKDLAAARALLRGRLALHACGACGFVFNQAFDPALLSYGEEYDNTQSCSPAFEQHVEALADRVVFERGVRGSRIVEIGCGKGEFLRALIRRDGGNQGVGFDPSYVGPDSEQDGRVRFERRFYDRACSNPSPDAVVCRHVIEHLPDPVSLLRTVRDTLVPGAKVFFETPCVEWILDREVIWDFFYEHCSYFTEASLATAFERSGFSVHSVRHTFEGQYLWIEAEASPAGAPKATPTRRSDVPAMARRFAAREATHLETLRQRLEALRALGPIAMWGAAAKGVTLANLVDPGCQLITCVVDLNPKKQGGRLPGTGHPIIAPQDLASWGIQTAVLTNPNYFDENARLVRELSLAVRLVDLMQ